MFDLSLTKGLAFTYRINFDNLVIFLCFRVFKAIILKLVFQLSSLFTFFLNFVLYSKAIAISSSENLQLNYLLGKIIIY
jgi:hypothetical protein